MGSAGKVVVRLGALARGAGLALLLASGAVAPALAQNPICPQLEAQLGALDRGVGARAQQQNQAARIRSDLDRLTSQANGMGCDAPRGFLIFQGPPRPPQCDQISDQISRLRSALAAAERSGGDDQGQRRALIIALAQNNCGPQYAAAVRQVPQQPQRPRNFFEALFGGPIQSGETSPDLEVLPLEPARPSSYKTVCVRTCDGFFFPMANYSSPGRFAQDEALCKRLCPAAETQLFTIPGDDIRNATNVAGVSYMSMPNALRYRKELVPSCTCRAPGQSWAQALSGLEDKTTLRKGDIIVTEEQAREMSQPRFSDGKTRGGAPAPAAPAEAQPGAPSLAATASAPLAPASEQPGQRQVRVIPLPPSQPVQPKPTAAESAEIGAKSVPLQQ
ncbi:DUF2865 domain-containing protein [Xanthobacter sp. KR7-225]|uniref:DUF2865 domain-containing protein n=1 Tax=Xanthobacter sp. KR7-225 TaxID=3156613 RepID=UPI0032B3EF9A